MCVIFRRRKSTFADESESDSEEEMDFGSLSQGVKSKYDLMISDEKVGFITTVYSVSTGFEHALLYASQTGQYYLKIPPIKRVEDQSQGYR